MCVYLMCVFNVCVNVCVNVRVHACAIALSFIDECHNIFNSSFLLFFICISPSIKNTKHPTTHRRRKRPRCVQRNCDLRSAQCSACGRLCRCDVYDVTNTQYAEMCFHHTEHHTHSTSHTQYITCLSHTQYITHTVHRISSTIYHSHHDSRQPYSLIHS